MPSFPNGQSRARAVIVYKNSLILMKRHWNNGLYYVFPGGGVEKGETIKQALVRECMEELGIKVSVGKLFATQTFYGQREYFYLCTYVSGKIGSGEGEEFTRGDQYNGKHEVEVVSKRKLQDVVLLPSQISDDVLKKFFGINRNKIGILKKLEGTDRRSTGNADAIAVQLVRHPSLFDEVFEGLDSKNPVTRMRAADALEKASSKNTALLVRHKERLLEILPKETQQEVQWHLCQMIPRVWWTTSQIQQAARVFQHWIRNPKIKSGIVKTFSLQAIFDLAQDEPRLMPLLKKELVFCEKGGTPAMKSRVKKLKKQLEKRNNGK